MNVQSTNNTYAMNALRVYDDDHSAAIVLMASDGEAEKALGRVFEIHEAPLADLETGVPWGADDVGDCEIRSGGVLLTVKGTGGSFMGLRFEAEWSTTSPGWRRAARDSGYVWLALPGRPAYDQIARAVASGSQVQLPAMPVLKLEVTR